MVIILNFYGFFFPAGTPRIRPKLFLPFPKTHPENEIKSIPLLHSKGKKTLKRPQKEPKKFSER